MSEVARRSGTLPARRRGGIRVAPALAVLLLAPGLSGCILGSERPELNLEVPARLSRSAKNSVDAAVPALDWWRGFRSKELTTLMEDAQVFNLDIAVAIAQVVQADAQVGVNGAPLFPSVTGTATAEQEKVSTATAGGGRLGAAGGGAVDLLQLQSRPDRELHDRLLGQESRRRFTPPRKAPPRRAITARS